MFDYQIEAPSWFKEHWEGHGNENWTQSGKPYKVAEKEKSYSDIGLEYALGTKKILGKNLMESIQKKGTLEAQEEILFDCNEMAKGEKYFKLSGLSISMDNQYAIFAIDNVGRRIYSLQIKNLFTGEILSDKIENTTGNATWANDNKTIFYTTQDKVTLRSDKVFKHKLGSDAKKDVLIFKIDIKRQHDPQQKQ